MTKTYLSKRDKETRRSWLFVAGADKGALLAAPKAGSDVLIQELETFTPPHQRPEAWRICSEVLLSWRQAGAVTSVRINPLDSGGLDDLRATMPARPEIIMISLVSTPEQVVALADAITQLEQELNIPVGTTEIVPNVESPLGVVNTMEIATCSSRISAVLVGTEDMVAEIGAQRSRSGEELKYVRSRFLLECAAVGVQAIDCPYSYADMEGAASDMKTSLALGYRAKAIVNTPFVSLVNEFLTPSASEITTAKQIISAFDAVSSKSNGKRVAAAVSNGFLAEVPDYLSAKRLLKRAAIFDLD